MIHPGRPGFSKQIQLGSEDVSFGFFEQLDDSKLSVIAGVNMHFAPAHAADRFFEPGTAQPFQFFQGGVLQNAQLRAEFGQQVGMQPANPFRSGPDAEHLRQHFRQGNQADIRMPALRFDAFRTVGQLCHPVHHSNRHRPSADRAAAIVIASGLRRPANAAFAVSVKVIFPLFRKELDRALKAIRIAVFQSIKNRRVGELGFKMVCLPGQLGWGVGIGIGNQGEAVECGKLPVHRRIGGKAGLQGKNMRGEVFETFLDPVKPGFGAKERKPGGPNMSRDQVGLGIGFQYDLEQIAGVQPQDGAAVGTDVADFFQLDLECLHRFQGGEEHHIVDLADFIEFLVDIADLAGQHKAHFSPAGRRDFRIDSGRNLRFEAEQPGLRRFQLFAHLLQPAGMGDVAAAHHLHSLQLRPFVKLLKIEILAGRP